MIMCVENTSIILLAPIYKCAFTKMPDIQKTYERDIFWTAGWIAFKFYTMVPYVFFIM